MYEREQDLETLRSFGILELTTSLIIIDNIKEKASIKVNIIH
jgi:hypothetical protein